MSTFTLKKPVITEKAMQRNGVYVFIVDRQATKREIAHEVESTYHVTVSNVRTMVLKGHVKSVGKKRIQKLQPLRKKAYVTVSKGEIADLKIK